MNLSDITYSNKTIEDRETFDVLPNDLKEFYLTCNGMIALQGGIQFRGCVSEPKWNSLYQIWKGTSNLHSIYDSIVEKDIPIAQDAFGDQYIYRYGQIYRLFSESGELDDLDCTLEQFIKEIEKDAINYLSLQQIRDLAVKGIVLKNGEMMNVYPPFIFKSDTERKYKAVPTQEQIDFLKDLYLQTKDLEEGEQIKI